MATTTAHSLEPTFGAVLPFFPGVASSVAAPREPVELTPHRSARAWLGALSVPAVAAVPAFVGALVGRARGARAAVLAGLGVALGLGFFRWQLQRLFTEQQRYARAGRIGRIRIRDYAPEIVVQTTVMHRTFGESLDEGFRRLAAYLREEAIAMTSPVTVTYDAGGVTVAIALHDVLLPDPHDPHLTLRELPARRVAARRYVGGYDGDRAWREQRRLVRDLERHGLATRGDPWLAAYDPPSTLVPLRRVEALVELA